MLVANIRIIQSYQIYTLWGELIILVSILAFYAVLVFESYVCYPSGAPMFNDMYGVFQNMSGDAIFWVNQLFCLMVLPAADFLIGISINAVKQRAGFLKENEEFSNLSEPFQTR